MKNPLVFLLQFIAWLFLFAMLFVTWAGVTYPNGRTKAYPPEFSMIHPLCIHRIFIGHYTEIAYSQATTLYLRMNPSPLIHPR